MKRYDYRDLGDTVFSETLSNGLKILVIPKLGFHKTYANLTVNYGSIDNQFYLDGNLITMPKGIAHFLEHKMFDKKDYDAFDLFSKYGTDANAFTDYTQTSYLFSTTNHIKENLNILLNFVQKPYFNKDKVQKEKGIIGQEIKMYNDDPNSKLYTDTVMNMYQDTPLNSDIAGTINSIEKITVDDLYLAHRIFYKPSNMVLTISGNVNPTDVIKTVKLNQSEKQFSNQVINRYYHSGDLIVHKSKSEMNISMPKVAIGIKGTDQIPTGSESIKYEIAISMFFEIMFSENSTEYLNLYNDGIIDDSFTFEFDNERGFHFGILIGNTIHINEFIKRISKLLLSNQTILNRKIDDFKLIKREELGRHIFMMNYPEVIANQMGNKIDHFTNLYDEFNIINNMNLSDVQKAVNQFIDPDNLSVKIIEPKK
ncbi:peptidase M16 [Philodulcilactobacillus myokoensis]|uniref:Peptidase M16 n=1 Tax=Philodulcilactobacillus myokoensis TaxID=2929573 RepID=A0A9W6B111_9LACO|nr:pitrilysin family protein [Philodulcilactobacillus myokoensis]GLB46668.1 peptidase M16 [Philodulcilactobacillus myokoensis]